MTKERVMNDELPEGWSQAPIGSLCDLKNGRAFKPTEWSNQGLPIVRIQNLNNPNAKFNYFEGHFEDRYLLRGGELLFAWSGTPGTSFGAHVWRGGKAVLNQHIFRVDFNDANLDKRFFRYAINQKLDELIGVAHGGVGLRHVTKGTFENTEISLPPLAEQKRIADKLEAVLGRVDACRARLDRVPDLLKRFRQSVLAAATSGQLTEDWREKHGVSLDASWRDTTLSALCSSISDGDHLPPPQTTDGIPFLTIGNISSGRLDFSSTRFVAESYFKNIKGTRVPCVGDTLYSVVGATIGIAVLVDTDRPFCFQRHIAILKPSESTVPKFLHLLMASPTVFREAWTQTTGTAQPTLPLGNLRSLSVSVPLLPEQAEIVRRVEALFAMADRIEARLSTARAQVERLTPATLAKAFRGDLVPQDPNDEPASKLLERLKPN